MLDNLYLNARIFCAKKLEAFLTEERGDVNIVSIVVLIGIVVILATVFKDAIGKLITDLLNAIVPKATDVATETIAAGP